MSTYTPIATQTLGSAASSVTFSSIPQGYTDLILICSTNQTSGGTADLSLQFNADTGSNYSATALSGNGSSALSNRYSNENWVRCTYYGYLDAAIGTYIINLQNYSNSTTYKTLISRANSTSNGTGSSVGLWRSTNAINEVKIMCTGNNATNFPAGSTFSLYGIQVGDKAQKAQGGNIVASDGTYMYHAFTTSGSFTPSEALTADVLVIGGGGGGGAGHGGGGGAGGYRLLTSQSLTATTKAVIVGAGGTGAPTGGYLKGISGSNSVFGSITATGGGGGGSRWDANGISGGSGGGAGYQGSAGSGNAGSYSPVEGYAGGGGGGSNTAGSGGGGSSTPGETDNDGANGGAGGAGTAPGSNWASTTKTGVSGYYAGGGGGGANGAFNNGAGGSGGAGGGGYQSAGVSAVTNTGSGGGGGYSGGGQSAGGNGGSGIVIIRYAL